MGRFTCYRERDATGFFEQPRILGPGIAREAEGPSLGFLVLLVNEFRNRDRRKFSDSFIRVCLLVYFCFEKKKNQQGRQKSQQEKGEGEKESVCFLS